MQSIIRQAGLAVQVHCCLPRSWVPPLDPPRADNAHVDRMDLSVAPHTALLQPPSLGPNGFSDLEDEHEGLIDRKESFTLRAGMTAAENGAALGARLCRLFPVITFLFIHAFHLQITYVYIQSHQVFSRNFLYSA